MWDIIIGAISVYIGGLAIVGTMIGIEEIVTKVRQAKNDRIWKQRPPQ